MARVTIVGLTLVTGAVQVLWLPSIASGLAIRYPQVAHLAAPYLAATAVAAGTFVLALLCAWVLAPAAVGGASPLPRLGLWADLMTGSLVVTALALAGVCAHAGFVANVGGPPILFGLLISLALIPAAFVLRRGVLRVMSPRRS